MKSLEEYVLDLLDSKKSQLVYHDIAHTKQVIKTAVEIAKKEAIDEGDLLLLKTAALLHDTGYIYTVKGHEEKSCEIAREVLPKYDFTLQQIDEICRLIMATRIPQQPFNLLSQILCDADLYYLGTDAYKEYAEKLYLEQKNLNHAETPVNWLHQQINFLKSHRFFTDTASREFNSKKKEHLENLEMQLPVKKKAGKPKSNFFKEDIVQIVLGILISAFALNSFLVPNNFFDGGINGISLLIHKIYHVELAYVVFLANLPFILLGRMFIGNKFAVKTGICIILLSAAIYFIPFPVIITSDNVLVAIFGGFFFGVGNGLVMRAGSSLDGIEIFAFYTRRRTGFTNTEIIFVINFVIFLVAAIKFDIRIAMYSMVTYFTASKTVDYVVEGIEAFTGVTIISGKSEILKSRLVNELGRGITIYKGERGYLPSNFEVHNDVDIIFTVITRLELRKLKDVVYDTDPAAFVFASVIKEASGGILKKGKAHHEARRAPKHKTP